MNNEITNPLGISKDIVVSTEGEQIIGEVFLIESIDSHIRPYEIIIDKETGVQSIRYLQHPKSDDEKLRAVRNELSGLIDNDGKSNQ